MYQVYIKDKNTQAKKLIGEYRDADKACSRAEEELAKDSEIKYVIEETSGHVNSYGDLTTSVFDEN